MTKRLTRIYTRTGDKGTTGLGDGSRVSKDDIRVEAYGSVDELNSIIGIILSHELPAQANQVLTEVQHDLFDLGAELCIPGHQVITPEHILRLERALDEMNGELQPLEEFILPGGSMAAANAHHARTVCRRAERRVITLHQQQAVNDAVIGYLNRLSDLLFVLPRWLNKQAGQPDILWQPGRHNTP